MSSRNRKRDRVRNRCNLERFFWSGINPEKKKETGILYAGSSEEAREYLDANQFQLRQLRKLSRPLFLPTSQKAGSKEITLVTRQIATMLEAGLPLVATLTLCARINLNGQCRHILFRIKKALESGRSLSEALSESSGQFDHVYKNLISSAEYSGQLAQTFSQIADYREKTEHQRARLLKALLYPLIVLIVAMSVTYLILALVIPEFEAMFMGFGASLPLFTQYVIALSRWLNQNIIMQLIVFFSSAALVRILLTYSATLRFSLDKLLLTIPVLGKAISLSAISRFLRTLAVGIRAGVPIIDALDHCAGLSGNLYFEKKFSLLREQVASGTQIHTSLRIQRCFPEVLIQLVMAGEQSGSLDRMLEKAADMFESELDELTDRMGILIEPILILFLGSIVGALVIAIYLPIFNMMNVLG